MNWHQLSKFFLLRFRRFTQTSLLLLFFFAGPLLLPAQEVDHFAQIGNKAAATRTHLLVAPKPPILPVKKLPIFSGRTGLFKPMNRMDTPEELLEELSKKRKQYEPFLQNHAPSLPATKDLIPVTEFNWRIETAADQKDFSSVLQGKGSWEKVTISHYGPPLGKAATYYQTEVEFPPAFFQKGAVFIRFKAADYKAHVFINGAYVGSHEGAFAPFEFDITSVAHEGTNQLLVKVENDYPMGGHAGDDGRKLDGDKIYAATGLGYDDPVLGWHHNPPGMGIYQEVQIEARSTLHINDIFVRPIADTDTAEVWLEINNTEANYQYIKVQHSLYGQNFTETIYANAMYEPTTVQIPGIGDLAKPTDWEYKKLPMGKAVNFLRFRIFIHNAKRWSPETPWLYQLQLKVLNEHGELMDAAQQQFGMRSFRMDTVRTPKGAMYLNGQFIRLRGANTMGSFMQDVKRKDWQQLVDDILLAKIANMNYMRMTQFPVQQEVYDYCDRLGLMTQTDLPIFGVLRRNKWAECVRQAEEMERLVRSHPCNIMVTYINERFPNAEGAPQRDLDTYEDFEKFFKAADQAILLNNPERVIKAGDGDYDPPSPGLPDNHVYNGWYNGHGLGLGEMYKGYWLPVKPGWFYACGEFGSEGLDFYNTMQQFYPQSWLPQNNAEEKEWTPNRISMAQTYRFHYMWFNRQSSVQDWITASQEHQAWVTRITTESFRRNNSLVSFAIHLFIDAWPAGWMKSIMDVKRQPKPAYFEYAHALAPLAVSLRSDRNQFFSGEPMPVEVWIANDKNQAPTNYTIRYQWEQDGNVVSTGKATATISANKSTYQGSITMPAPMVNQRTPYTLRLQLLNNGREPVHESDFKVDVFPAPKAVTKKLWVGGVNNSLAKNLAKEIGATLVAKAGAADVLLIDSMETYQQQQAEIDGYIKGGKTAIFLQPPAGKWFIAGDTVTVSKTTMGKYYFVSPVLSHPMLNGFRPRDFFFWYNGAKGLVSPLLGEMSQMQGWTPLLRTGQTSWVGSNDYAFATAEKAWGKGKVIINHVQLAGRIKYNPTARAFFLRLLGEQ